MVQGIQQATKDCCSRVGGFFSKLDPRECNDKKVAQVAATVFACCLFALLGTILIIHCHTIHTFAYTALSIGTVASLIALCVAGAKHCRNAHAVSNIERPLEDEGYGSGYEAEREEELEQGSFEARRQAVRDKVQELAEGKAAQRLAAGATQFATAAVELVDEATQ